MNKTAIICVDDELVILKSLKSQLRNHFGGRYDIEIVDSGEEAIALFDELIDEGYDVPVVISDQLMPGMTGDEFLADIHQKGLEVKKILLTGQATSDAIGRAVNNAGLYRYFEKPWSKDDLLFTVGEAIKSYFQEKKLKEIEEEKDKLLVELRNVNESLEEKIQERTYELENQKRLLEVRNQDITDSISYAKVIQESILPTDEEMNVVIEDSFVFYKPRNMVSGDFYWIYPNFDRSFYLAVADCTGHGVPGAFMSVLGTSLFNESAKLHELLSPATIFEDVRQGIVDTLRQKEGAQIDGIDAALLYYQPETKRIEFSGACNGLFLLRERGVELVYDSGETCEPYATQNDVNLYFIKGDRQPLAFHFDGEYPFTNICFNTQSGDEIYMTTDGYLDQFGGDANKKFMKRRFVALLFEAHHKTNSEKRNLFSERMNTWMGGEDQTDDMCVVGIRL